MCGCSSGVRQFAEAAQNFRHEGAEAEGLGDIAIEPGVANSEPARTLVVPVYVFAPESVSVPVETLFTNICVVPSAITPEKSPAPTLIVAGVPVLKLATPPAPLRRPRSTDTPSTCKVCPADTFQVAAALPAVKEASRVNRPAVPPSVIVPVTVVPEDGVDTIIVGGGVAGVVALATAE